MPIKVKIQFTAPLTNVIIKDVSPSGSSHTLPTVIPKDCEQITANDQDGVATIDLSGEKKDGVPVIVRAPIKSGQPYNFP